MDSIQTHDIPHCPHCGAVGQLLQGNVPDPDHNIPGVWQYQTCTQASCAWTWLSPAPLPSELWKAYTQYHTHTVTKTPKLHKHLLSIWHRILRTAYTPSWWLNGMAREQNAMRYLTVEDLPKGRLLDVGCGGGRYVRRMQRQGWQVEGMDFDEQATRKVQARYGIPTHTGDLLACQLPAASFDVITMSHTIEHVTDPLRTLQECLRVLKPGGRVVLATPNLASRAAALFGAAWRGWEPPRHLHLFNLTTLQALLREAGFEIEQARATAAASAITYRVSLTNQRLAENGESTPNLGQQCRDLLWAYHQEAADFAAQQRGEPVAQNLVVRGRRPV